MLKLLEKNAEPDVAKRRRASQGRIARRWRQNTNPVALCLLLGLFAFDLFAVFLITIGIDLAYHSVVYGIVADPAWINAAVFSVGFVAIYGVSQNYGPARIRAAKISSVITSWIICFIFIIIIAFLGKIGDLYSRGSILLLLCLGPLLLYGARLGLFSLLGRVSVLNNHLYRRVLLVGTSEAMTSLRGAFENSHEYCLLTNFCIRDGDESGVDQATRDAEDLKLATSLARLIHPDEVVIALPLSDPQRIRSCLGSLMDVPAAIYLYVDELFRPGDLPPARDRIGDHLLLLSQKPMTLAGSLVKRLFDIVGAAVALVLFIPVMIVVAAAIKLDSPGPVFFVQTRYGFNWTRFKILKFRTMHVREDGREVRQATRDDPRITRVGRILRRWNLDELPQILNVLTGTMSLVGPRPHAMAHDQAFFQELTHYARRHNVKPGITGWAQVNGFRGEITDKDSLRQRLFHDLYYIDHWSVLLDIKIVFLTVFSSKAYRNAR